MQMAAVLFPEKSDCCHATAAAGAEKEWRNPEGIIAGWNVQRC
jgi:hypothetical protein